LQIIVLIERTEITSEVIDQICKKYRHFNFYVDFYR
jgi:hypothetical protein